MAILFTLKFFARNLPRVSQQRNIFSHFILMPSLNRDLMSNKPTHYLLLPYLTQNIYNYALWSKNLIQSQYFFQCSIALIRI